MSKFKRIFRDLLLFVLLIVVCKNALERSIVHIQQENKNPWKKFDVHEVDTDFNKAIKSVKNQISQVINLAKDRGINKEKIKKMEDFKKEIINLEVKYNKNSPATFLLGPIGTTAIVLKEEKIKNSC